MTSSFGVLGPVGKDHGLGLWKSQRPDDASSPPLSLQDGPERVNILGSVGRSLFQCSALPYYGKGTTWKWTGTAVWVCPSNFICGR